MVDRDRAAAARRVLERLEPDVVVLNEALFCQQFGGKQVDYGALFGFEFASCALYDQAWGNAVLSKFPILAVREMRTENRGGLVVTLRTPEGPITVASYHPHPARNPRCRVRDFTRLVEGIEGPLLVGGDLNCIHPDDAPERDHLVAAFQMFSSEPEAAVDRFVEAGQLVFSALAELGLRDAVPPAGRRYTIPTDLLRESKESAMRIDHILCNEAVRVVGGEVVHSPDTHRASDHHPVMLDFRL